MPPHYEALEPPRPVWVKNPNDRRWYPGISVGRLYPAWPDRRSVRFDIAYADDSGTMYRGTVYDHLVESRSPLAEPEKDAPCARCGTSPRVPQFVGRRDRRIGGLICEDAPRRELESCHYTLRRPPRPYLCRSGGV